MKVISFSKGYINSPWILLFELKGPTLIQKKVFKYSYTRKEVFMNEIDLIYKLLSIIYHSLSILLTIFKKYK